MRWSFFVNLENVRREQMENEEFGGWVAKAHKCFCVFTLGLHRSSFLGFIFRIL